METNNQQQFFDLIAKAQRILIALPKNPNGDTLGSGLALASFLKKLNKEVEVISETKNFEQYSFLPGINNIGNAVNLPKNFVISVNTEKTALEELSYDVLKGKVNIYLKPKEGVFEQSDVSFGSEAPSFNLIICVDTPSLESLGSLYEKNTEVFFNTPKVNIDNHINNENYATLNIIDVTASSTAEILLTLLKNYEEALIDADMATNLLTGIVHETHSFQHPTTTPNSFQNASDLIAFGARREDIITNLFKTKDLSVLKLWGRALARMQEWPELSAVYSAVTISDQEKSGITKDQLRKVAQDFAASLGGSKVGFFVAEQVDGVEVFIVAHPNIKVAELAHHFGGEFSADGLVHAYLKDVGLEAVAQKARTALEDLKQQLGI